MMKLKALSFAAILASCGGDPPVTPPANTCTSVEGTVTAGPLSIRRPTRVVNGCKPIPVPGATEGEEQCEEIAPDLSCLGKPRTPGVPINVTFRGCVSTFGINATSYGLTVAVFKETLGGGVNVDPGYDVNGMPGEQAENTPAAFVGKTISTEVPIAECPDQGAFSIPNVPTETPLIVRVTRQHIAKELRRYVDTYQYGIYLRNDIVTDAAGAVIADPVTACQAAACFSSDKVNTIQSGTYTTISRAAGVTGVRGESDLYDGDGQGHVAGEVQDCTSNNKLQNAAVSIDAMARRLTYFDVGYGRVGKLENPNPSTTRTLTNADGIYVALAVDTQPGGREITIGAAIMPSLCGDDGVCQCLPDDAGKNPAWTAADAHEAETVVLGTRKVFTFPDSVTIMTFDRVLYTAP